MLNCPVLLVVKGDKDSEIVCANCTHHNRPGVLEHTDTRSPPRQAESQPLGHVTWTELWETAPEVLAFQKFEHQWGTEKSTAYGGRNKANRKNFRLSGWFLLNHRSVPDRTVPVEATVGSNRWRSWPPLPTVSSPTYSTLETQCSCFRQDLLQPLYQKSGTAIVPEASPHSTPPK